MSQGTYIGLRATNRTHELLHKRFTRLGLKDIVDDLHVTLLYDPVNDIVPVYKPRPEKVYDCYVTGWDTLGTGKWAALVLKLRCPALMRRHAAITKVYGVEHSYPELTLHVSLKYQPTRLDKEIVYSDTDILGRKLSFNGEYVEPIIGG